MLFIWGILPTALYANDQLPVDNVWLVHQTPLSSQNYTFNLRWGRPPAATTPLNPPAGFMGSPNNPGGLVGGAAAANAWHQHRATHYNIMRRDASTMPTAWVNVGSTQSIIDEPSFQFVNNNLPSAQRMQNGRIYGFRIDASHIHRTQNPPPMIGTTDTFVTAQGS